MTASASTTISNSAEEGVGGQPSATSTLTVETANQVTDTVQLPDQAQVQAFLTNYASQLTEISNQVAQMSASMEAFYNDPARGALRKEQFPPNVILDNANLPDAARLEKAKQLLGLKEFTPQQEAAIMAAHAYSEQQGGIFMMGTGEKTVRGRLLVEAGFDEEQIRLLGDSGLCGAERIISNIGDIGANAAFFALAGTTFVDCDLETQLLIYGMYRALRAFLAKAEIDELTHAKLSVVKGLLGTKGISMLVGVVGAIVVLIAKTGRFDDIEFVEGLKNIHIGQLGAMTAFEIYSFYKNISGGLESTEGRGYPRGGE